VVEREQTHVLTCIECGAAWLDSSERWRLYLTSDEPPEAVPYCPDCNEREFGEDA